MTAVLAPQPDAALYPPTVEPPPRPLPLRRFLSAFVRNPLSSLPQPVYEEPIVCVPTTGAAASPRSPVLP